MPAIMQNEALIFNSFSMQTGKKNENRENENRENVIEKRDREDENRKDKNRENEIEKTVMFIVCLIRLVIRGVSVEISECLRNQIGCLRSSSLKYIKTYPDWRTG